MAGSECARLDELRALIGDCHRCPLGDSRTTLVFGTGDAHARVMLIGEAPGRSEDLTGVPFVGAAGKFLDELLGHAGLVRDDVYIANVVKCRPPGNRNPAPLEIDTCAPFLREQIRLVDPVVIVTLGNFATRAVLKTDESITALRGRVRLVDSRSVLSVFHPAAAIYDRTKRDVLLADFATLGEVVALAAARSRAQASTQDAVNLGDVDGHGQSDGHGQESVF